MQLSRCYDSKAAAAPTATGALEYVQRMYLALAVPPLPEEPADRWKELNSRDTQAPSSNYGSFRFVRVFLIQRINNSRQFINSQL